MTKFYAISTLLHLIDNESTPGVQKPTYFYIREARPIPPYDRPGVAVQLLRATQQRMAGYPASTIYPIALRGVHEIHERGRRSPRLRSADLRQGYYRTPPLPRRILQIMDLHDRP